MRKTWLVVVLVAIFMLPAWAEETQRSPYDRVATGKPPQRDETVKVYTNSDLEKLFGIVAEEDREAGAADDADERPTPATNRRPAKSSDDALKWLQERRAQQAASATAMQEAQSELAKARERLANLEKQLMAVRNPFSARPQLTEEEKEQRRNQPESANERYKRTEALVEEAREEVRAAEAKLAEIRSQRP